MMMMGGGHGPGGMLRQEARHAKNTGETLSRLLGYFAPYRLVLLGVAVLIILITGVGVGSFSEHEVGDVMSRLTNDVDTITQAVNFGLVQVVSGSLSLIGIIIAMLALNTSLALVSLLVIPFMAGVTVLL